MSEADFEVKAEAVRGLKNINQDTQLKLYALFKQASLGDVNCKRPGMLDFVGKAKWDAWAALRGLGLAEARQQYIEMADSLLQSPESHEALKGGGSGFGGSFGVKPSTGGALEGDAASGTQDIFYFASENKVEEVERFLASGVSVNSVDETGQSALHYAADRGHFEMVEVLLAHPGCSVNIQGEDGQTPLHYAYLSEHQDVVELLLEAKADVDISDEDGVTPAQLKQSM